MPIVNVMWANPKTLQFEPYLLNTEFVVSIEHVLTTPKGTGCGVKLASGEWLLIRGTLEDLEEEIYYASQHDAKPQSLQGNPWVQK